MKKKTLAILLALSMVISMVPTAWAADASERGVIGLKDANGTYKLATVTTDGEEGEYTVNITGTVVQSTASAEDAGDKAGTAYWIGVGIPVPDEETYTNAYVCYGNAETEDFTKLAFWQESCDENLQDEATGYAYWQKITDANKTHTVKLAIVWATADQVGTNSSDEKAIKPNEGQNAGYNIANLEAEGLKVEYFTITWENLELEAPVESPEPEETEPTEPSETPECKCECGCEDTCEACEDECNCPEEGDCTCGDENCPDTDKSCEDCEDENCECGDNCNCSEDNCGCVGCPEDEPGAAREGTGTGHIKGLKPNDDTAVAVTLTTNRTAAGKYTVAVSGGTVTKTNSDEAGGEEYWVGIGIVRPSDDYTSVSYYKGETVNWQENHGNADGGKLDVMQGDDDELGFGIWLAADKVESVVYHLKWTGEQETDDIVETYTITVNKAALEFDPPLPEEPTTPPASSGTTAPSTSVGSATTDEDADTTTVEVSVSSTTSGTTANATVSSSSMNSAVNKAVSAAEKAETAPVVEIEVSTSSRATSLNLTLPVASLETLAEAEDSSLVIISKLAEVTLDNAALAALADEAAGNTVTLQVAPVAASKLTEEQKETVGDSAVIDLSMVSGNKPIHDYKGGKITISLPYELAEGQEGALLQVYYLPEEGEVEVCPTSYADGKVTFTTAHLSMYFVAYEEWENPFVDVDEADEAYAAIRFAAINGLMKGYENVDGTVDHFGPADAFNRAQMAQVLYNLAGQPELDPEAENPFGDVPANEWYVGVVSWAYNEGLISGYGRSGLYGPTDAVKLQDVVVMLSRFDGEEIENGEDAESVTVGSITCTGYAETFIQWAVDEGILDAEVELDASADATRAQIAQLLMNYCNK